jgi:hypothetical protein
MWGLFFFFLLNTKLIGYAALTPIAGNAMDQIMFTVSRSDYGPRGRAVLAGTHVCCGYNIELDVPGGIFDLTL